MEGFHLKEYYQQTSSVIHENLRGIVKDSIDDKKHPAWLKLCIPDSERAALTDSAFHVQLRRHAHAAERVINLMGGVNARAKLDMDTYRTVEGFTLVPSQTTSRQCRKSALLDSSRSLRTRYGKSNRSRTIR